MKTITLFSSFPKQRLFMYLVLISMICSTGLYFGLAIKDVSSFGLKSEWADKNHIDPNTGTLLTFGVSDLEPVWQGNAYSLRGINPYDIMKSPELASQDVGRFVFLTANVPWSYILSNIFLPGFLPFNIAGIISLIWVVFLWSAALIILYRRFIVPFTNDTLFRAILLLSMLCQFPAAVSLMNMNPAIIVLPLLFIACFMDSKKYPYIIGLILGFAMIKPQLAALFFIPFFIRKEWKVIFTGISVVFLALIAESILIGENPIYLTIHSFTAGTDIIAVFSKSNVDTPIAHSSGMLYFLIPYIGNTFVTMIQWIIIIPLTFYLCYRFRKARFYILFSIPLILSHLWMYNLPSNRHIGILCIALLVSLYNKKQSLCYTFSSLFVLAISFSPIYSSNLCYALGGAFYLYDIACISTVLGLFLILWNYTKESKNIEQTH